MRRTYLRDALRRLGLFTLCCAGLFVALIYGVDLLRALACLALQRTCETPLWWVGILIALTGVGSVAFIWSWLALPPPNPEC